MKIYNYKCSYCGVSIKIIPKDLLEIDHYILKHCFSSSTESERIENLVLSCSKCNRAKGEYYINKSYADLFHPDNRSIENIFKRDKDYYIRINDDYITDDIILGFYEKLKLNFQVKRLDYLLMNMKGIYEKLKGSPEEVLLAECIMEIENKRRMF